MEPISLLIISGVYFIATFLGSIVGGSSLITVPTLILFGLSPHMAIGTNKIGIVGQTSGSSFGYGTEHKIDYKFAFSFMIFLIIGSVFGSLTILSISENVVRYFIGIVMIVTAGFLLFNHEFGLNNSRKKGNKTLLAIFSFGIGFFGGMYGAGLGMIVRIVLAAFFGYALVNSAAITSFSVVGANFISLLIFSYFGIVDFSLFFPLLIIGLIGGYLGSKYAVKVGNIKVKRIFSAAAILMAIKLLFF